MTRKFQAGLMSILLLLGISCTKENTNSPNRSSVQATNESQTADALAPLVLKGNWTLYFDWFCTGSPNSTSMTVNAGGTWSDGFGETGEWITGDGLFAFHFNGFNTVYGGHIRGGGIDGLQGEFLASNASGCFTMAKVVFSGKSVPGQYLPSGTKSLAPASLNQSRLPENLVRSSGGDETIDLATKGIWLLYYDWGCTGSPSSIGIKFNSDGTFVDRLNETGQWVRGDNIILFHFDGFHTVYTGRIRNGQIDGIQGEYNGTGSQGCFNMVKVWGAPGVTLKKGQRLPTGKIY